MKKAKPIKLLLIDFGASQQEFWNSSLALKENDQIIQRTSNEDVVEHFHNELPDLVIIDSYFSASFNDHSQAKDTLYQLKNCLPKRPIFHVSPEYAFQNWCFAGADNNHAVKASFSKSLLGMVTTTINHCRANEPGLNGELGSYQTAGIA